MCWCTKAKAWKQFRDRAPLIISADISQTPTLGDLDSAGEGFTFHTPSKPEMTTINEHFKNLSVQ